MSSWTRILAWILLILSLVSLVSSLGLIGSYNSFASNPLLIVAFSFIIITIVLEVTMCFTAGMIVYLYICTLLLIAPVVILFFVYSQTEKDTTDWAFVTSAASLSVIALFVIICFTLLELRNEKQKEVGRTINDIFITFNVNKLSVVDMQPSLSTTTSEKELSTTTSSPEKELSTTLQLTDTDAVEIGRDGGIETINTNQEQALVV